MYALDCVGKCDSAFVGVQVNKDTPPIWSLTVTVNSIGVGQLS